MAIEPDHEAKQPLGELAAASVRYKSCMSGMHGPSKIGFGRSPLIEVDRRAADRPSPPSLTLIRSPTSGYMQLCLMPARTGQAVDRHELLRANPDKSTSLCST